MANLKPAFSANLGSVYNVDCMELLSTIGDGRIDTVFADPPFNFSKDYGNGKDKTRTRTRTTLKTATT